MIYRLINLANGAMIIFQDAPDIKSAIQRILRNKFEDLKGFVQVSIQSETQARLLLPVPGMNVKYDVEAIS